MRTALGDTSWCNTTTGEGCLIDGSWQANPWAAFLSSNQGTALNISLALISGESEMRRAQQWLERWVTPFSNQAKPGAPPFLREATAPTPSVPLLTPAQILAAATNINHGSPTLPDSTSDQTTTNRALAAAGVLVLLAAFLLRR